MTLPSKVISQLGLLWRRRGSAELADGTAITFDVYEATVMWNGRPRRIEVDEANTLPLVGMAMLEDHELKIQIHSGGSVQIRRLPR